MGTVLEELTNLVRSTRWTSSAPDHYLHVVSQATRAASFSTMPPSPLIRGYDFEADMDLVSRKATVRVLPHLEMEVWRRLKAVPDLQLFHRSGMAAVSVKPLIMNEVDRRIGRLDEHRAKLETLRVTPSQSHELFRIVMDELRGHMRFQEDNARTWFKEHEEASVLPGKPWAEFVSAPSGVLKELFEISKEALERIDAIDNPDEVSIVQPPNIGDRARKPAVPESIEIGQWLSGTLDRTRLITFLFPVSGQGPWLQDHPGMYRRCMDRTADLFPSSGELFGPLFSGGQAYAEAADAFNSYQHFASHDGVNHESAVPNIVPSVGPWSFKMGGWRHLGSGVTPTTLWDSIVTQIYHSKLVDPRVHGDYKYAIQGDDLSLWSDSPPPKIDNGLLEYQEADSALGFFLGPCYKITSDPYRPGKAGLNFTTDNARKRIPLGSFLGRVPLRLIERGGFTLARAHEYVDTFYGTYPGDRTFVEIVRKLPPGSVFNSLHDRILDGDLRRL